MDHVVPLAEAWDSGAKAWTKAKRVTYANYLDGERHLEAVSQRSNRQKSDQDVTDWLPVDSAVCKYLTSWVPIKLSWNLTVDQAEHAAARLAPVPSALPAVRVHPRRFPFRLSQNLVPHPYERVLQPPHPTADAAVRRGRPDRECADR
ncbi:HNH endonuclease family protein [Streptomyces sp. NPDC056948]|uniref:HNH endonuclease family protein n=1 Tax=Streptomyces sp. NPDC056948 TaxID=3345975 RepID=UPI003626F88C